MPMGPIELADVVGLDVVLHVGEIVTRELQREIAALTRAAARAGAGAASSAARAARVSIRWQDGKIGARADAACRPPADLADRLILALVNECVACLREGIVDDADLIDAGVIFGTGFAPFRGGPIDYARARGIDACVARLSD